MKPWSVLALIAAVLAFISLGAAQKENMPTGKAFIKNAAEINIGEIALGKLAEAKGQNQAIKDFGKRMLEDHTKAEDALQRIAKQEGVTLPKQPSAEGKSLHQQLSSASGAQFDEAYIRHMLSGHKGAIADFEKEIEDGRTPAIKSYAETVLPIIQDHIRVAEDVAGKMDLAGKQGLEDPYKAITASAKPR